MNLLPIKLQIARMSQTKEDVDRILQELASYDWDAILAEELKIKALEEDQRLSKIFHCETCQQSFQRRELTVIWNDFYCKDCEHTIRKDHTFICLICKKEYLSKDTPESEMEICDKCEFETKLYTCILHQRARARRGNAEYTLTLSQWLITWNYFERKCAYCLKLAGYIEHFLPVTLGGGTTINNCIPACNSCNLKKSNRHPDKLDNFFPADNLARIRNYLSQYSAKYTHVRPNASSSQFLGV